MATKTTRHKPLSTGEVAAITGLSQQTVTRCIDKGDLPGFRVPMSRFRRVTREAVTAWAGRHNLELHWERLNKEQRA